MRGNVTYTYGQLSTRQLSCDPAYQRDPDPRRVKQIADHWNPLKANIIKVSHRDGKYWIFDGQHTELAMILRNGGNDLFVECKIYEGLTRQGEAELFARQNELAKRVGIGDELKALYASGDAEVVEFKKAIEEAGLICDFSKVPGDNKLICYQKALNIFRKSRQYDFIDFLSLIRDAWNGEPDSMRNEVIGGMWLFWRTFKRDIDAKQFIKKMKAIRPMSIVADGKAFKDMKGDLKYAYAIALKYNKGQRKYAIDTSKMLQQ